MDNFIQFEIVLFLLIVATIFVALILDTSPKQVVEIMVKKEKLIISSPVLNTGYIDDNKTRSLLKFIFYSTIILTIIYLLGIILMIRV